MKTVKAIAYILGVVAAAIYLLNPTAGVFELVPDNIPFVGHVDEVTAVALLLASVRGLRKLRRGVSDEGTEPQEDAASQG